MSGQLKQPQMRNQSNASQFMLQQGNNFSNVNSVNSVNSTTQQIGLVNKDGMMVPMLVMPVQGNQGMPIGFPPQNLMQQPGMQNPILVPVSGGFQPGTPTQQPGQHPSQFQTRSNSGPDAYAQLTQQQLQQLQTSAGGNPAGTPPVVIGNQSLMIGGNQPPGNNAKNAKSAPKSAKAAGPIMVGPSPTMMGSSSKAPAPEASERKEEGEGGFNDPLISGLMQLVAKNGWRVEVRPNEGKEGQQDGKAGAPKPSAPQPQQPPPPPQGPPGNVQMMQMSQQQQQGMKPAKPMAGSNPNVLQLGQKTPNSAMADPSMPPNMAQNLASGMQGQSPPSKRAPGFAGMSQQQQPQQPQPQQAQQQFQQQIGQFAAHKQAQPQLQQQLQQQAQQKQKQMPPKQQPQQAPQQAQQQAQQGQGKGQKAGGPPLENSFLELCSRNGWNVEVIRNLGLGGMVPGMMPPDMPDAAKAELAQQQQQGGQPARAMKAEQHQHQHHQHQHQQEQRLYQQHLTQHQPPVPPGLPPQAQQLQQQQNQQVQQQQRQQKQTQQQQKERKNSKKSPQRLSNSPSAAPQMQLQQDQILTPLQLPPTGTGMSTILTQQLPSPMAGTSPMTSPTWVPQQPQPFPASAAGMMPGQGANMMAPPARTLASGSPPMQPVGAAPPSPGMAPMGAGMPDMMMQQLFGEFPPDIPPELLKNLPKPGAANVDVGLRPEMYAEVLAAMQQAVKQNAENEQAQAAMMQAVSSFMPTMNMPGRGWPSPSMEAQENLTVPEDAAAPSPTINSPAQQRQRPESPVEERRNGNLFAARSPNKANLSDLKGREDFDTSTVEEPAAPEVQPTPHEPGRAEMFGTENVEAPATEKTSNPAGFTPTRGKYKMAMKITQPLGIVQCSLPDGSKGFGAGRGKPVA